MNPEPRTRNPEIRYSEPQTLIPALFSSLDPKLPTPSTKPQLHSEIELKPPSSQAGFRARERERDRKRDNGSRALGPRRPHAVGYPLCGETLGAIGTFR